MAVDYTPSFDPADVDSDYGSTGGDITVPTFTANMKPFRFWCQRALPLVYDDSLSYYEVLCKVVDQLNGFLTDLQTATGSIGEFAQQFVINQQFLNDMADQLGQNVEDLETYINNRMDDFTAAYQQLQSYVNNYFDNLDVQQEINNKLDEMAQDGTLNTLFDPVLQTWMTQKTAQIDADLANQNQTLATQNSRISVLEGRMDTFASLPSGSTSGNAELLDIRTNFLGETFGNAGDAVRASDLLSSGFVSLPLSLPSWQGMGDQYYTFNVERYKGGHIAIILNAGIRGYMPSASGESLMFGSTEIPTAYSDMTYIHISDLINANETVTIDYTDTTAYTDPVRELVTFEIPTDFPYNFITVEPAVSSDISDAIAPDIIVYGTNWIETPTDTTLTQPGEAADAKATGDGISSLNERLEDLAEKTTTNIDSTHLWTFEDGLTAGIVNTARFSTYACSGGKLKSVYAKFRDADANGNASIVLAEVVDSEATIYALIPITIHANASTNTEYVNGVDFNYNNYVKPNTIFGVWSTESRQVYYGDETGVYSYGVPTETPLNHTFSVASHNSYNVAVGFNVGEIIPKKESIAVLGDSWTDIVNTTYIRWPVLLGQRGYNVKSYGVTGSNITSHVANQVSSFLAEKPNADIVILMGGINDYRGGVSANSIIEAVTNYYNQIKTAYPYARIIYLANNQLYFTADQLKFFNSIVEALNVSGIEAYAMFGWVAPNQYNSNDLLHPGNSGNVCIANNIVRILNGGDIKTVVNKLHWDIFEGTSRIGQLNIYEIFENGWPFIKIRGVASNAMANRTVEKTINDRSLLVSAPWSAFPYAINNVNNRVSVHTPYAESIGDNKQVTSFVLTITTTNTGFEFVTEPNCFTFT